jgi:hypothetical protein
MWIVTDSKGNQVGEHATEDEAHALATILTSKEPENMFEYTIIEK